MITDGQTNFVFLADTLAYKYPEFAKDFVSKLIQEGIPYAILPNTNDVWAVDYMPIQVSETKFIRFTYKPDYLVTNKKLAKSISDVDSICGQIGIKTIKSDLIVDGGNISKGNDKVLMTTKVFIENRTVPEQELIDRIQNLLEINKLIFIPVEKGDWLGHADGLARFASQDTVLINDFGLDEQKTYINLLAALHNSGLKWKGFPNDCFRNDDYDDAAGLYLNYLELTDHILMPVFGREADQPAIEIAKEIFQGKKVIPVMSNEPAKDTGIINCLTWNIKK